MRPYLLAMFSIVGLSVGIALMVHAYREANPPPPEKTIEELDAEHMKEMEAFGVDADEYRRMKEELRREKLEHLRRGGRPAPPPQGGTYTGTKDCKKGCRCGHTCISCKKTCRQ